MTDDAIRVLVADDNDMDRMLLSTIVRKQGYEVEVAVDGLDALQKRPARSQLP